jgi:DNA-binding transcriptional ArsR family regulator
VKGRGSCVPFLDTIPIFYYYLTVKLISSRDVTLPHPIPEDLVELVARRFRAVGEPLRIRLLDELRGSEATVNDLADAVGASQQNVSKHLAVLAEAGILGRRKEGTHVYYRIADEGVLDLCEEVCGSVQQRLQTLAVLVGGGER